MLPSFLYPSYKQYKSDSDTIATWLANTARKCGYPKDLLPAELFSPPKPPKLRGRARKLARDAVKQKAKVTHNDDGANRHQKYLISLDSFLSLSEWIVKSEKPVVVVPLSFVEVLDRTIAVRKRHSKWWNNRASNTSDIDIDIKKSIKTHDHFIGVLEEVRKILQPRMTLETQRDPIAATKMKETANSKAKSADMVNKFKDLEIEDLSDNSSDETLIFTPASSEATMDEQEYAMKQEMDLEEVYFAVHCLFNDLDNLRRYIKQVWSGYKTGAFELVPASIVTNTAIDFARLLQEDFCEMFPQHTDFEQHINLLFVQHCLHSGQNPFFKDRPDDEMNFTVYEASDKMMYPTFILLSAFRNVLRSNSLPIYKPGHFGIYDATSDRKTKSSREKFREDKTLLMELLPDFCVLARTPHVPFAEDEMTRGMREMIKQDKMPVWLVFATQIVLDIHHILRDEVSRGCQDLVLSAQYIKTGIERVLDFHKDLRVDTWPKSNDQVLVQILELITTWVHTDVVADTRKFLTRRSAIEVPPAEPFYLLKQHPMYCGLLSFSLKALCQEASITFANAWGSVLYSAHLYNALRQEELLSDTWQDMNLALFMHRTEDMFIGDFPKSFEDYFKRFTLAMGYSASNFAKNKRSGPVTASRAGPRCLNELSPVSSIFKARFCYNENRINMSPDDIDLILKVNVDSDVDYSEIEDSEWVVPKIEVRVGTDQSTDDAKQGSSARHQKMKRSAASGIRPVQLINALLNAIQSEMLELTFDHFRLHTFSWRLLRSLQKALDEDLRKYYGPAYIEKENQLPFVVGYIFMTAAQSSSLAGTLLPKKDKSLVTSKLFMKAAAVLKTMIDTGAGEIEMSMLRNHFGIDVDMEDILAPIGDE